MLVNIPGHRPISKQISLSRLLNQPHLLLDAIVLSISGQDECNIQSGSHHLTWSSQQGGFYRKTNFRIINRQDLLASDSDVFEDNTSKSFSQLLFDVARDQVIVGARDTLYRLSLRGLRELERANWPAPEGKTKLCQDKGQTEDSCRNYIKVLLSYGHKLFACGTNAFSPMCNRINHMVSELVSGVPNCPHKSKLQCDSHLRQYRASIMPVPQLIFQAPTQLYAGVAGAPRPVRLTIYSRIARVCQNDSGRPSCYERQLEHFLEGASQVSRAGRRALLLKRRGPER
ncbi:unnamed protein product [Danaus chrysippus]|uniref:(African queen) hypothetical protein n=1 Tax=Danaus chrysippus TaxID=151541 RepID=A0A8J2QU43_9NEOP|nr:unnamed protein product [Danaus chrysippus]